MGDFDQVAQNLAMTDKHILELWCIMICKQYCIVCLIFAKKIDFLNVYECFVCMRVCVACV